MGGRTRAVAFDVRDESILVAGAVSGGIWRSTDSGQSWQKVTLPHQLHSISCLVQDTRPGREDTWYAGTGEASGGNDLARDMVPYRGDGIFKSTDNGQTWQLLPSTSSGTPQRGNLLDWTWRLAVDSSNLEQDEVYVAAWGSIHRSLDGGASWQRVLGGPGRAALYTDVVTTSTGIVYGVLSFGSDQGIYRSADGEEWTEITPSGWPSSFNRIVPAIAPSNEDVAYFVTETTRTFAESMVNPAFSMWRYRYLSGDGSGSGGIWEDRSHNVPRTYSGIGYTLALAVYPEDENMVFLGMQSLYRSRDGFATDTAVRNIGDARYTFYHAYGFHCDEHAVVFSRTDPRVAYVAHDGGVSVTSDITATGVHWTSLEHGYTTSQHYTVAIVPDAAYDPRILGCMHDNGVYLTQSGDSQVPWDYMMYGDGAFAAFLQGGSKFIVSWQEGNTYLGRQIPGDGSALDSWTRINPPIENPVFINPFAVDPNDDRLMYLSGGRSLLRCRDLSAIPLDGSQREKPEHWQTIATAPAAVTAIAVSREPADVLYFGTESGGIVRLDGAAGESPVETNVSQNRGLPSRAYVSNIAVHPHDAGHAVVSFSNYEVQSVFATWDGGTTWHHVSGNLEEYPSGSGAGPAVNWVAILPGNGRSVYYAATSAGLYSTVRLDGSDTVWALEGATVIGNVNVKMVVTREVDREVVVATYGTGVYSRGAGRVRASDSSG